MTRRDNKDHHGPYQFDAKGEKMQPALALASRRDCPDTVIESGNVYLNFFQARLLITIILIGIKVPTGY